MNEILKIREVNSQVLGRPVNMTPGHPNLICPSLYNGSNLGATSDGPDYGLRMVSGHTTC